MCSPRSKEQWVVGIVESCWNSVNLCLLTFHLWEKDLGIPRRIWLTDGDPPCGWARATSRTIIWSELTKELCTREAYDDLSRKLVRRKPSSRCRNTREAEADDNGHPSCSRTFAPPPQALEVPEDEKEGPKTEPEEDEEMQGEPSDTKKQHQERRAQAETRSAQRHKRMCL